MFGLIFCGHIHLFVFAFVCLFPCFIVLLVSLFCLFVSLAHLVWSHPLETGAGAGVEEGRGDWTKPTNDLRKNNIRDVYGTAGFADSSLMTL